MENQVPQDVVKDRFDRLLKEVQTISAKMTSRFTGTVQEVLAEEINSHKEGLLTGRLGSNILVHFPGTEEEIGKLIEVSLDECRGFYYMGSRVEEERKKP